MIQESGFHLPNTPLASAALCLALLLAGGCAGRPVPPEAPILARVDGTADARGSARLDALMPVDMLLLGEQHDAPDHQRLAQDVIASLAGRSILAAVGLEMAEVGNSTAVLQPSATEEQVRHALKWDDRSWPWKSYGPAVMAAVRAGVPVMGANLPRSQMAASMADAQLDGRLPGPALKAQQQRIRLGHCNLLPEGQITPMTRIQVAKDITMANALQQAALPGKVVLLLSGNGHVDLAVGVPRHLRSDLKVKAISLRAGTAAGDDAGSYDAVWETPALPATDYCAGLQKQLAVPAPARP